MPDESEEVIEDLWVPYEDLLVEDWVPEGERTDALIPMCGVRIVSAVDSDGTIQLRWDVEGESDPAHVLGCLEQVKFLYQLREFANNSMSLGEDDDELDLDDE